MGRPRNYIENGNISLDIQFEASSHTLNEGFTVVKTSIMSSDEIANGFKFSKELIESKLYQLQMLPMVAYVKDGEVQGHCEETVPYGAILPNSYGFEMINGKEYLTCYTAIWTERYPEIGDLSKLNQSMEIAGVCGHYSKEDKFYDVSDFRFDALCALGENVRPAFKEARVNNEVFSDTFEKFKQEFSKVLESIDLTQYQEKGDENVEEIKDQEEIKDEQNMATEEDKVEDIVTDENEEMVNNEDETVEESEDGNEDGEEVGSDETTPETKSEENSGEDDNEKEPEKENFELSHSDVRDLLAKKLDAYDADGYRKYDVWVTEVFDNYCHYQVWNDDNKYYKADYVKTQDDVIIGHVEEIFVKYLTKPEVDLLEVAKLDNERKLNELAVRYSELETEVTSLREFKLEKEEEENKVKVEMELAKKHELIESFATKLPKEMIETVIEKINDKTFEEIKVELSVAFAEQVLNEKEDDKSTFANIDTSNKTVSTKDKLIAELKARSKK